MDTKEILNRRARHDFEILETYEAGLVLKGTEVKSIRQGKAALQGAFARVDNKGEVWLIGANIQEYTQGNRFNHEPLRFRKLLLRRPEIHKLHQASVVEGHSLVPLKLYFSDRGFAKILIGVGKGKREVDRREDIKKRDTEREIRRAMGRRR